MDSSEETAKSIRASMEMYDAAINKIVNDGGELVIIPFQSAAIATLVVTCEVFKKILCFNDVEGEYIPLEDRFDLPSEPNMNVGFTFVGNDTWQPKSLYEARNRQRNKAARKNETAAVWTR